MSTRDRNMHWIAIDVVADDCIGDEYISVVSRYRVECSQQMRVKARNYRLDRARVSLRRQRLRKITHVANLFHNLRSSQTTSLSEVQGHRGLYRYTIIIRWPKQTINDWVSWVFISSWTIAQGHRKSSGNCGWVLQVMEHKERKSTLKDLICLVW